MSALYEDKDRKVIPRWRDFISTVLSGELDPVGRPAHTIVPLEEFLASKLNAWQINRSLAFATDLVACAVVLGAKEAAQDAAEFILSNRSKASRTAVRVAEKALGRGELRTHTEKLEEIDEEDIRKRIHDGRVRLREEPRNAFLWVDIARGYTNLGQGRAARDAMDKALWLADQNRFVLRVAARLHVHIDDVERAHDILRRAEVTKYDPWVLAAEIAVSSAAGRSSRLIKRARSMAKDADFSAFSLSELTSALATLEFQAGNLKRARKLFRDSLVEATENAVAQAAWTARRMSGLEVEVLQRAIDNTPGSYEALAHKSYQAADWPSTVSYAWDWLKDQPFSSRPATLGSYVTAVALADYERSMTFLQKGLTANPRDFALLNNIAFAFAQKGDIQKARGYFSKIDTDSLTQVQEVVWLATSGLLAYREGQATNGRRLYLDAIEKARTANKCLESLARSFLALEELQHGGSDATQLVKEALEGAERHKQDDPALMAVLQRLVKTQKT